MQGYTRARVMLCLIVGAGIGMGYVFEGYTIGTRVCIGVLYSLMFFSVFFPMQSGTEYKQATVEHRLPRWLRALLRLRT